MVDCPILATRAQEARNVLSALEHEHGWVYMNLSARFTVGGETFDAIGSLEFRQYPGGSSLVGTNSVVRGVRYYPQAVKISIRAEGSPPADPREIWLPPVIIRRSEFGDDFLEYAEWGSSYLDFEVCTDTLLRATALNGDHAEIEIPQWSYARPEHHQ